MIVGGVGVTVKEDTIVGDTAIIGFVDELQVVAKPVAGAAFDDRFEATQRQLIVSRVKFGVPNLRIGGQAGYVV